MSTRALVSGRIDKRRGRVTMRGVVTTATGSSLDYDTSIRPAMDDAALKLIDRDAVNYDENGELIG